MIQTSNSNINNFQVGGTTGTVYVGNTLVWPTEDDYTYKLQGLTVNYSSGDALHPNCNNYVWLTSKLLKQLNGETVNGEGETVTLIPEFGTSSTLNTEEKKALYNIDTTNNRITAKTDKKTTQYDSASVVFTGKYVINNQTLYPTIGTTSSSVFLIANEVTTTYETRVTTSIKDPQLSRETLSAYASADTETSVTTIVTCTKVYTLTKRKDTYTSGESTGGEILTGQEQTGFNPTTATATKRNSSIPNDQLTISKNINTGEVTIKANINKSTNDLSWNVKAVYKETINGSEVTFTTSTSTILTQRANSYEYGNISVTMFCDADGDDGNTMAVVPASGDNVQFSVSYSQPRYWAGDTNNVESYIRSGLNVKYYQYNSGWTQINGDTISVGSMGADTTSSVTYNGVTYSRKVGQYRTTVTNTSIYPNKSGNSNEISIYQEKNEVTSISTTITIYNSSNQAITSYNFEPYSDYIIFTAEGKRTKTYKSTYTDPTPSETVYKPTLTATKTAGDWLTCSSNNSSSWKLSASENTATTARTGGVLKVNDGTYGSKEITISQKKATYSFDYHNPSSNTKTIEASDTSMNIYVESIQNGHHLAISKNDINISYPASNAMATISKGTVTESDDCIYLAPFTFASNSQSVSKTATITFTQPFSNSKLSYSITQKARPVGSITTSSNIIILGTTQGTSASFKLTASNYNWSIASTSFLLCDYAGDMVGYTSNALSSFNKTSGSAGSNISITFKRGSWTQNTIVDISLKCDNSTAHVIVVPDLTIARSVTSWNPTYASGSKSVLNTQYPDDCITWETTANWLTGSGKYLSVASNSNMSGRSATAVATGTIQGNFFGINYTGKKSTDNIFWTNPTNKPSGTSSVTVSQSGIVYEFTKVTQSIPSIAYNASANAFSVTITSTLNGNLHPIDRIEFSNSNMGLTYNITKSTANPDSDYTITFSCSTNNGQERSSNITIYQSNSGYYVTYSVTQAAYVAPAITINNNGGSDPVFLYVSPNSNATGSFSLKANRNWSIQTSCVIYDFDGDVISSSSRELTIGSTSGSSSSTNTTINFSRNNTTYASRAIDIMITAGTQSTGLTTRHVIVLPSFSIARSVSSWNPTSASGSSNVLTTNYPDDFITWSTTANWLTGSGKYLSVTSNTSTSARSASAVASGSIYGEILNTSFFESPAKTTSSISVNQQGKEAQKTKIYACCKKSSPNTIWISTSITSYNSSQQNKIAAPTDIYIDSIDVLDGNNEMEYTGTCLIGEGDQAGNIEWDSSKSLSSVGTIMNGGEGTITCSSMAEYEIGNNYKVYWFN